MDILLIFGLLLLNGMLSMSEMAMASSQRVRLRHRAERGSAGAAAAIKISEAPTRFLSTVQVGITLIGILSGAVGEGAISDDLRPFIAQFALLEPWSAQISTAIVVGIITLCSVVLGELVPKRLALLAPETIASAFAIPMMIISRIAAPLVIFLTLMTELLLLPFKSRIKANSGVTSQEINIMVQEGAQSGEFTPEEQRLVERVLHLGDQRIGPMMVHRTEMTWFDINTPLDKARRVARTSPLLHFPVCRGSVDKIVGVLDVRDLLPSENAAADLKSLIKPPVFVPESAPVLRVLERCRQAKTAIAFIVDEYGAVQGEVSVDRILDQLVGKVWSGERQESGGRTPA